LTLGPAQSGTDAISKIRRERKQTPVFDSVVELRKGRLHEWRVVLDTATAVDSILRTGRYAVQQRWRDPEVGDIWAHDEHAGGTAASGPAEAVRQTWGKGAVDGQWCNRQFKNREALSSHLTFNKTCSHWIGCICWVDCEQEAARSFFATVYLNAFAYHAHPPTL
jgi:hypothetical protein